MTKDKSKAYIEEIYERSDQKSTPVLLKFQNGVLKNTHKDCTLYFPAKSKTDNTKRAVVVTSGNVYSGPISDGSNEPVDTYICVRNKTTNKVRIIPVDQAKLINHVYEDKLNTQFKMLSKEDAADKLVQNFGGRKALRNLHTRERNKVSIDVVQDQLEAAVENSEILDSQEQVVSTADVIDRIRPKFNSGATNIESVYSISDVIPLELLNRLDEEVAVLLTTEVNDIPISSEFLKNCITTLKKKSQSSQTLLKMKMIVYMDGLMALIKSKGKVLKRIELSKITEKIETDIRERFSSENAVQKVRTSFTNEKALCYFLVLGFLVSDDYELNLATLSTELCMPKTKILRYGNLVNAQLKFRTNMLSLRLPSTVKQINFSFVGKRRKH